MAMKTITFSADADQLELARRIAEVKGTTLEEEVRQWLSDLGEGKWKPTKKIKKSRKGAKESSG